jgi:hypothetical protein
MNNKLSAVVAVAQVGQPSDSFSSIYRPTPPPKGKCRPKPRLEHELCEANDRFGSKADIRAARAVVPSVPATGLIALSLLHKNSRRCTKMAGDSG